MAYRIRYLFKLKNTASFIEAVRRFEELNRLAKARDVAPGRTMTQSFGPFNGIAIDVDYPDLATYERETKRLFELPEVQTSWSRQMGSSARTPASRHVGGRL